MHLRSVAVPIAFAAASTFGQGVTVQQPAFESFSIGTSVSVPDRGTAVLGGVGRAASGRAAFGPHPGRSATGGVVSASSTSASALIHDFEAMDAAVLDAADGTGPRPPFTKSRYSDSTSYDMHRRFGMSMRSTPRVTDPDRLMRSARLEGEGAPPADHRRLLTLGDAAMRRGKPGVAAIHYRIAAKRGSVEAEERLANLGTEDIGALSDRTREANGRPPVRPKQ